MINYNTPTGKTTFLKQYSDDLIDIAIDNVPGVYTKLHTSNLFINPEEEFKKVGINWYQIYKAYETSEQNYITQLFCNLIDIPTFSELICKLPSNQADVSSILIDEASICFKEISAENGYLITSPTVDIFRQECIFPYAIQQSNKNLDYILRFKKNVTGLKILIFYLFFYFFIYLITYHLIFFITYFIIKFY